MRYIDGDGKKVKFNMNEFKFLDSGGCASVYDNNILIFKRYHKGTPNNLKLRKDVFNILKQIKSANFIKLYNSYYVEYNYKRINFNDEYLDAYTAEYYQKENIIPALINKDYLLENLKKLDDLFELLSDNRIETNDVRVQNTILTKESIVIIDPDFFEIHRNSKKEIRIWNKARLLNLVRDLLLKIELFKDYNTMEKMERWFDDNFDLNEITESTDLAYELSKKLKYVKKPIEVIRK